MTVLNVFKHSLFNKLIPMFLCVAFSLPVQAAPPFTGTSFISSDIISPTSKSALVNVTDAGRQTRDVFDRRAGGWITVQARVYKAAYDDGLRLELRLNPEFADPVHARSLAEFYARVIGQLPAVLRREIHTATVHAGMQLFAGGNHDLLIYEDQGEDYHRRGFLEEILIHEASHAALDPFHAAAPAWLRARDADGAFISTYARDFPDREDVAESFQAWIALRHRPQVVATTHRDTIARLIPHRIAYFDALAPDMYPMAAPSPVPEPGPEPQPEWVQIRSMWLGEGLRLDVNPAGLDPGLQMAACVDLTGQFWQFVPAPGGLHLKNMWLGPERCLDGEDPRDLRLAACSGVRTQLWQLGSGSGEFRTITSADGFCLDVAGDGVNLQLAACVNLTGQLWAL